MTLKAELKELQTLLAKYELSAPELAERLRCSLPTVYRRLLALSKLGAIITEVRERRSKPGPTPSRFRLTRAVSQAEIGARIYGA